MNDVKVVKVTPIENVFSISWMVTSRCNYDCMYCTPEFHDQTSKPIDLTQLQQYWINIFEKTKHKNLKYKISFTGGEITVVKDFIKFLKWLDTEYKEYIDSILCTTNGSASLTYYQRLFKYAGHVTFSFHSEHANEQKFFDKIIALKQILPSEKILHVNIMNEFWNTDRIPLYRELLEKNSIYYSVNEIYYNKQTRTYPIMKGKLNLVH